MSYCIIYTNMKPIFMQYFDEFYIQIFQCFSHGLLCRLIWQLLTVPIYFCRQISTFVKTLHNNRPRRESLHNWDLAMTLNKITRIPLTFQVFLTTFRLFKILIINHSLVSQLYIFQGRLQQRRNLSGKFFRCLGI